MAGTRRFGTIGFSKQSAINVPALTPDFTVPMISGNINPQKEYDDLPRQGSTMEKLGRFTTKAHGGGQVTMLCNPDAVGHLFKQAFGSEIVAGGPFPAPFSHTFTMQDNYPGVIPGDNPLTVWTSIGSVTALGQTWKFADCYIRRLKVSGTSGQNIQIEVDFISWTYAPLASFPAITAGLVGGLSTTLRAQGAEPRYKFIGSTVSLDPIYPGPLVPLTNIESAEFEIDRSPEIKYGPSLTPQVIAPDRMVNFSAAMTYDSAQLGWEFLNTVMTGSPTGTGPEQSVPHGAATLTYGRHPYDALRLMTLTSNGHNWQYTTERPDAEATPGLMELNLQGMFIFPTTAYGGSGTTECTLVLNNDYDVVY